MSIPEIVKETIINYLNHIDLKDGNKEKKREILYNIWRKNKEIELLLPESLEYDITKLALGIEKGFQEQLYKYMKNLNLQDKKNTTFIIKELLSKAFDVDENLIISETVSQELGSKLNYSSNPYVIRSEAEDKTFALCHHCYSNVSKVPYTYLLTGKCFRKEKSNNKFRKQEFKLLEVVHFNNREDLIQLKRKYLYLFSQIGEALSPLPFKIIVANDSFISNDPQLILYQLLEFTKVELQIYSSEFNQYISVGSINMHGNYFSKKFGIEKNGQLVNSMCMGIGIDRFEEFIGELMVENKRSGSN